MRQGDLENLEFIFKVVLVTNQSLYNFSLILVENLLMMFEKMLQAFY